MAPIDTFPAKGEAYRTGTGAGGPGGWVGWAGWAVGGVVAAPGVLRKPKDHPKANGDVLHTSFGHRNRP